MWMYEYNVVNTIFRCDSLFFLSLVEDMCQFYPQLSDGNAEAAEAWWVEVGLHEFRIKLKASLEKFWSGCSSGKFCCLALSSSTFLFL